MKRKYRHLDVLPDDGMDLQRVNVVLGQDNYHLLFPAAYRKSNRNEPWVVTTKLGWALSGPLPDHGVAQVASTSHIAAEDDGLGAQLKTWFSMESFATRVDVSGRSREAKMTLEQLVKTTKMGNGHYGVELLWAEDNATIQNNHLRHILNSVHWNDDCRRTNPSSRVTRRLSMLTCYIAMFVNQKETSWMKPKTKDNGMSRIIKLTHTNPKRSNKYATQEPNTRESRWMTRSWQDQICCRISLESFSDSESTKLIWQQN